MFNNELTLDDFVCSIPLCHSGADLGSIVEIFLHCRSNSIAIAQENNNWGVISSRSLLTLFAQRWQKQGIISVSHPRKTAEAEAMNQAIAHEFDSFIEPAIVYPSHLKLAHFLQHLENLHDCSIERVYLIVNEKGKLQGRVDRNKILKYLAQIMGKSQLNPPQTLKISESRAKQLDLAALPWKIETQSGQDVYSNSVWQELVAKSSEIEEELPNLAIANWWIEQTHTDSAEVAQTHNDFQKVTLFERCHAISPEDVLPVKAKAKLDTFIPVSSTQNFPSFNPGSEEPEGLKKGKKLKVEIEQQQEWCYIKIPISTKNTLEANNIDCSWYWFTIATRAFIEPKLIKKRSPEIIDELLGILNHELKSPLTGIVGLSSLLKEQQLGKLNQRQTLYAQLIYNSGQKLVAIVNDLLELQSLIEQKSEIDTPALSLDSLCLQAYQQSTTKLQRGKIVDSEFESIDTQLKLEIEPELAITTVNQSHLSAILSYLLLETFQFADSSNNTIVIQVENRNGQTTKCPIAITVSNGLVARGHSEVSIKHSAVSKQSSGWNLILAKYLAPQLSGEITSSYPEQGCQLTLSLPASSVFSLEDNSQVGSVSFPNNKPQNLTVLLLYPEAEAINCQSDRQNDLDFNLKHWAEQDWSQISKQNSNYQHRIIEADGLGQAHILARIWQLDVILLDGHQITNPAEYLRSLQKSSYLAALPLITLDTRTTEAANQIEGLNVYPCLIPAQCRSIDDLIQVIQIATDN